MLRFILITGVCTLLTGCAQGQNILGKHPSDKVLPSFFSQNGNADTTLQGINGSSLSLAPGRIPGLDASKIVSGSLNPSRIGGGASGTVLTSGAAGLPSWQPLPGGLGESPSINLKLGSSVARIRNLGSGLAFEDLDHGATAIFSDGRFSAPVFQGAFQGSLAISAGAALGRVLTSDLEGNASWQEVPPIEASKISYTSAESVFSYRLFNNQGLLECHTSYDDTLAFSVDRMGTVSIPETLDVTGSIIIRNGGQLIGDVTLSPGEQQGTVRIGGAMSVDAANKVNFTVPLFIQGDDGKAYEVGVSVINNLPTLYIKH